MAKYLDSTGLSHLWSLIKSKLVPSGGTAGQVLAKASATDHDLTWITPSSGPGGSVTGVKGDAESSYRTGDVNITPANIGIPTETTVITKASTFFTAASGFTAYSSGYNRFASCGKVAMLELTLTRSSAWTANAQVKVGTLKQGYRPAIAAYGNTMTNNTIGTVTLSTDGSVYVRPPSQVASGSQYRFGATFLLA